MLVEHLGGRAPEQIFASALDYRPLPSIHDREAWQGLPDRVKARLLQEGGEALAYAWPTLPATRFLDYKRNGNRTRFQELHFERRKKLVKLVLAECVEHQGRFADAIVNGVWAICEESSWCLPAHLYLSRKAKDDGLPDMSEPTIDLMAAETAVLMAGTYFLLRDVLDEVSLSVCKRIRHELRIRIFEPYMTRNDFWWMGLDSDRPVNNWNPWVNSGVLFSFLLVEEEPEARSGAICKILASLDRFIASYADDGGCDEGPAYWDRAAGSLFDCLDMLYAASGGRFDVYRERLIRQMGLYICKMFIDGRSYVNFADAQPLLAVDGGVLYRYGLRLNETYMMSLGKHAVAYMGERDSLSLHRVVPMLFLADELEQTDGAPPYIRDAWMEHIQVMTARGGAGKAGFFLAAKGGHNDEQHNHNDVGQFMVYCNGLPVLIDVGPETYSAKTFGPQRYEIWTMRSAYHNLPLINGCEQPHGRAYAAAEVEYEAGERGAKLSMSLAEAYPPEAGITEWRRSCALHRDRIPCVAVTDSFRLIAPTSGIRIHFMTRYKPVAGSGNSLFLELPDGTTIVMELNPDKEMKIGIESIELRDDRARASWGDEIYRITLFPAVPVDSAVWTYTLRLRNPAD